VAFYSEKDPSDVVDYTIKWESFLGGETISTSVWTAEAGLVIDSELEDTFNAIVTVSGGTAGNVYLLSNRITTSGGETFERSIYVTVRQL